MASHYRTPFNTLRRRPPYSRTISSITPVKLPPTIPIEEETLPHYKPDEYFPVHVGDVFNAQYRVAGKPGYDAYSTSWLFHDTR